MRVASCPLIVLLALLIWIIVVVARTWVRNPKVEVDADEEPVIEVPRTQREWRTEAETAEATENMAPEIGNGRA